MHDSSVPEEHMTTEGRERDRDSELGYTHHSPTPGRKLGCTSPQLWLMTLKLMGKLGILHYLYNYFFVSR